MLKTNIYGKKTVGFTTFREEAASRRTLAIFDTAFVPWASLIFAKASSTSACAPTRKRAIFVIRGQQNRQRTNLIVIIRAAMTIRRTEIAAEIAIEIMRTAEIAIEVVREIGKGIQGNGAKLRGREIVTELVVDMTLILDSNS